ncbi:Ketosteroid isomerase-related protein [Marinobacter daqiaonensis]|uniref:Ketosteroid isomerase-related protein n=1 Tax=Marinobacter daqiaonensis TaxID=650891 RepID=A0A1I6JB82_9GAMM|nr:nuclear transport factor 2 family protein [Marinobacter daqiaonensis]SFR76247.1 Ketosteroid isomerase-related protein [Marinobacter daqiaonensis]
MIDTIRTWHRLMENRDVNGLDDLLAEDVVFHSPVVHTPQEGKAITSQYLAAAFYVLGNEQFRYLREVVDGNNAVLEFYTELDGVVINGIDMIHWNEEGRITDFKVMVRPLKAVNTLHQKMAAMLEARKGG